MEIRLIRILEYEGDDQAIYENLDKCYVKRKFETPKYTITETLLPPFKVENVSDFFEENLPET